MYCYRRTESDDRSLTAVGSINGIYIYIPKSDLWFFSGHYSIWHRESMESGLMVSPCHVQAVVRTSICSAVFGRTCWCQWKTCVFSWKRTGWKQWFMFFNRVCAARVVFFIGFNNMVNKYVHIWVKYSTLDQSYRTYSLIFKWKKVELTETNYIVKHIMVTTYNWSWLLFQYIFFLTNICTIVISWVKTTQSNNFAKYYECFTIKKLDSKKVYTVSYLTKYMLVIWTRQDI